MMRRLIVRGAGLRGPAGLDGNDGTDGTDGLPGVNAVPADTAVAAYINSPGSLTEAALSGNLSPRFTARGSAALPVAHLLVACHQSNNDGRATDYDPRIDITDPRVFQYGKTGTYANVISLAIEPLAGTLGTGMGPSSTLARRLVRDLPTNDIVVIVPCAVGGTPYLGSAPFGEWDPARGDAENLSAAAVARVVAACAELVTMGYAPLVQWVTSVHGETDGDNGTTGPNYATADERFWDYMLANLPNQAPDTVFVRGGMVPEYLTTGTRAAIRQAQIDLPRRRVRTAYADGILDASKGDGNHYRAKGARGLGNGMAAAAVRARLNITGTPAVTPTGLALVQSGTTVTATWLPVLGRATDFHLRYRLNGGSWATLSRSQSIDAVATIAGVANLGSTLEVQVDSENEQGTSAWSSTVSITLAQLPAALAGLAAGTATYSSQPLSWTASARAASYRVRFKTHAGSTWTTFGAVTGTSVTVTGLADGTSYDYEVTPVGAAGDGTNATVTASTVTMPVLLDGLTATAFDAVSTRKLRAAYSGPAIRVRRDSDNAEFDIGFLGSNLDVADLQAKVGAASGYVVKFFSQGLTAGRDWVQTNVACQGKIVDAGVVITAANGVPGIRLDGIDDHYVPATGMYAAGAASVGIVLQSTSGGIANGSIMDESRASSATGQYQLLRQASSGAQLTGYLQNDTGTGILALTATAVSPAPFNNAPRQISVVDTGSSFRKYVDTTAATPVSYTRAGTVTADAPAVGARVRGGTITNPWPGVIFECVRFASAISDTDRGVVEASQKAYFGTP